MYQSKKLKRGKKPFLTICLNCERYMDLQQNRRNVFIRKI